MGSKRDYLQVNVEDRSSSSHSCSHLEPKTPMAKRLRDTPLRMDVPSIRITPPQ
ncbi:hypothetical protein PROFUN_02545 [Planoprotostelium fungivorum]|uniref:Uncharacterized protein n=1 Tax=Planoprotostelium fungivorum TaxID=1890364 RepID=A0A2P6MPD5_9EUKA|nr:hypothetical protein PROFUN_02545 [Planoprotostelium fungivorum]